METEKRPEEQPACEQGGPAIRVATHIRCSGVANVARLIGCHPVQLSYILHGKRKPNDKIRRRLARMGITTTVDGKEL